MLGRLYPKKAPVLILQEAGRKTNQKIEEHITDMEISYP